MTTIAAAATGPLPPDADRVRPDGLLVRVRRACPEHGCEATCVGRDRRIGRLVFWCEDGAHFFRGRTA